MCIRDSDGTELAISESQERMACAIDAENKDRDVYKRQTFSRFFEKEKFRISS